MHVTCLARPDLQFWQRKSKADDAPPRKKARTEQREQPEHKEESDEDEDEEDGDEEDEEEEDEPLDEATRLTSTG